MAVDGTQSTANIGFLIAFDVIYVLGLVSLGAVFLTVWYSSSIKRASTWLMVVFSWIITSLGNLILVGQQTGRAPMTSACLIQATLIHGLPIFTSFYVTAFMLQVYLSIRLALKSNSSVSRFQMILLHAIPCGSFFCVLLEILILGATHPGSVQRHPLGMYCHLALSAPPKITAALTMAALAVFFVLEASIAVMLWRLWRSTGKLSPLRSHEHISFDVAVRVVIFGFCPMVAIAVSSLQYFPKTRIDTITTTIIQAVLPVVAGLIFGTQRDILYVWMFCRKKPDPLELKTDFA